MKSKDFNKKVRLLVNNAADTKVHIKPIIVIYTTIFYI